MSRFNPKLMHGDTEVMFKPDPAPSKGDPDFEAYIAQGHPLPKTHRIWRGKIFRLRRVDELNELEPLPNCQDGGQKADVNQRAYRRYEKFHQGRPCPLGPGHQNDNKHLEESKLPRRDDLRPRPQPKVKAPAPDSIPAGYRLVNHASPTFSLKFGRVVVLQVKPRSQFFSSVREYSDTQVLLTAVGSLAGCGIECRVIERVRR